MFYTDRFGCVFVMQIKVIDKDKVKILIETKDIEDLSVPDSLTDYSDDLAKEFILKILNETYHRTGINFLDSKILIETISGVSLSFYIIVTRLPEDSAVKNTSIKADEDMYLFELKQLESVYDVCAAMKKYENLKSGTDKIYKYKNRYYLSIDFPPETISSIEFKNLLRAISKFASKCKWNLMNEAFLCEWGELISVDPLKKITD